MFYLCFTCFLTNGTGVLGSFFSWLTALEEKTPAETEGNVMASDHYSLTNMSRVFILVKRIAQLSEAFDHFWLVSIWRTAPKGKAYCRYVFLVLQMKRMQLVNLLPIYAKLHLLMNNEWREMEKECHWVPGSLQMPHRQTPWRADERHSLAVFPETSIFFLI